MGKQRANGRCVCLKYMHTLFYTGWQGKPSLVSLEKKCMGGGAQRCVGKTQQGEETLKQSPGVEGL